MFYVQTDGAHYIPGPFADMSDAVLRAVSDARMRASRGDMASRGTITRATGRASDASNRTQSVTVEDVATWRYIGGDLQRVEVVYANDPDRPVYFDRDGATS